MRFTLRDMSALIASCESRPEEPIFNQLKGLAGRSILRPIDGQYGKKGALLFRISEVFRARLLLAAIDNGFASDKLAQLDAQMRFAGTGLNPITGAAVYHPSFDQAVDDLLSSEAPKFWVFEVAQRRIEGQLGFSGHWIVNGDRSGRLLPNWFELPSDHVWPYDGLEAVTSFAFSYLCMPLYRAIKAKAE